MRVGAHGDAECARKAKVSELELTLPVDQQILAERRARKEGSEWMRRCARDE